ncbi:MAG TPA: type VI secretion system baseplate subunit TssF [Stellaceae bacterium]|jgi:type VI secretion system protein ImpG|nr:type VI secretion system baseplate subunit TssF [Stellaceae bacterium]
MDPNLLRLYDQELKFVRELGGEFAAEFPKIAGRLGLDAFECADPYVERLLEGFAFLAARVQLKLEAEFPTFTQNLLDIVYPHFLAPTPSMAVVNFKPDLQGGKFENGYSIPRDTAMLGVLGRGDVTACEFRTAQDVTIWPITLTEVEYLSGTAAVSALGLADQRGAKAAIRLRLSTVGQIPFSALSLQSLTFFVRGATADASANILEQVLANPVGVALRPPVRPVPWQVTLPKSEIKQVGMRDEEALLPVSPRSFQGYRLLTEYFAFPDRFRFFTLTGLGPSVRRTNGTELEIFILLDRENKLLARGIGPENLLLNCAPAANVFPRRLDRIHITEKTNEHHLIADRNRPIDFEVYQILSVAGQGADLEREQEFLPFYARSDLTRDTDMGAYYTVRRLPRMLTAKQRRTGARTNYVGSEVYLSLVDAHEAPYAAELRQLSIRALCTNRDLPLAMPLGKGRTDFTVEMGAPLESIRVVGGPTRPRPSRAHGDIAWRLISHLALNYLSITNARDDSGAAGLREILSLYTDVSDVATLKQIEGIKSVTSGPIIRRLPGGGQTAIARGIEINVTFDETAFQGIGVFVLGMVLAEFFARYVSINSFTETVLKTLERGEVMRWPMMIGRRHTL